MIGMDVFAGNAFSTMSLSAAIDKVEFVPGFIGGLGLFEPVPVRTPKVSFDRREGSLTLISTSVRGAPRDNRKPDPRDMIQLDTVRLTRGFTLYADEVAGIRAHGSMTELETAMGEFVKRMADLKMDMDVTHEYHRLGALQGKLLDADGTTVIYDYFSEFSENETAAVDFALTTDTTDVRGKCSEVVRGMARDAKGAFTTATEVHALASDSFFDALIDHPKVRDTYLNRAKADSLQDRAAWESFFFGGITFHNYRGGYGDTDAVNVADGECRFFPVGARKMFQKCMAPHTTMEFVNTLGQETYAERKFEREGNPRESSYVEGDIFSYPLYVCTRPGALRKAVAST
jgi:hypothetical protein